MDIDDFNLDDLDSDLFGRKVASNPAKTKPSLSNLDSLLGGDTPSRRPTTAAASGGGARKPTVSFLDSLPSSSSGPRPSALDNLFADPPPTRPVASDSTFTSPSLPPSMQSSTPGGGGRRGRTYGVGNQGPQETAPPPPPPPLPSAPADSGGGSEVNARANRLEAEVERLNREIVDVRQRGREAEETLEKEWKERMAKRDAAHAEEIEGVKGGYIKQIDKMKEEHGVEVERLKESFARQIDAMQDVVGHSRDVTGMVDKVDELTAKLNKIAGDVHGATDRSSMERDAALRLREDQLAIREEALERERTRLDEDKKVVYELNAKLRDIVKDQEKTTTEEKWKAREEWNRLIAEKTVFKEDQKFILESTEKQKRALDAQRAAFLSEQHDLLVRVSNERATLDNERAAFTNQRNQDVRRLREESIALERRARGVQAAEMHSDDLKGHYEKKYREMQELESALMDECIELEKLRDSLRTGRAPPLHPATAPQSRERVKKRSSSAKPLIPMAKDPIQDDLPSEESDDPRDETVRSVLRKHNDFLEKYVGQKVAAVAPM